MPRVPAPARALLRALALALGLALAPPSTPARAAPPGGDLAREWVVGAVEAVRLVEAGALVLDAREGWLKAESAVPGAVPVGWADLAEPGAGSLLGDDAELGRRLRAWGVRAGTPVLVLADPLRGWGEDGRVAWALRALGHPAAMAVDGGLPALRAAGGVGAIRPPAAPGDFAVARRPALLETRDGLRAALLGPAAGEGGRPPPVVLDVREAREWAGGTPYGESRGGHVPGARHLYYKDLLAPDGTLLPAPDLLARLRAAGVAPGTEVVAYCTAGVRAGWVTAVLRDHGVEARNYAGSMREWSAGDPAAYPLVAGD